jgi:hypothetical protein
MEVSQDIVLCDASVQYMFCDAKDFGRWSSTLMLQVQLGHCNDVRCLTALHPKAEVHPRFCSASIQPRVQRCDGYR